MNELITFVIINLFGLLTSVALWIFVGSDKALNFIKRVPSIIRWLLTPIYALICWALCEAPIRFFTSGMLFFWGVETTESNVLIVGYTIIPLLGMYGLCWGAYMMAPFFKSNVVILIGCLMLSLQIYLFTSFDYSLPTDVMVETWSGIENASTFGSLIILVSYAAGFWLAIRSSYENSFFWH